MRIQPGIIWCTAGKYANDQRDGTHDKNFIDTAFVLHRKIRIM